MFKTGYLIKIVVAFGLMGAGMIAGYYGAIYDFIPLVLTSYPVFGTGAALAAWEESRRMDEGLTK